MHDDQETPLELTSELVPLFVIAKGRALPADHEYSRTALVTAQEGMSAAARTLTPEAREVMDLVSDGLLSVAEVAGRTQLPLGIVRILIAHLAEVGLVFVRPPTPRAVSHDRALLQAVVDGLQKTLGA
ncbi:DUF742 domain-containing protein [Streptomyces pseudovenezuelae]|uniref:DUF742 domain-containing protein n=1 Tax=Streptomyces pseudovenezuelae TaxID=67350 RepID=A0A124HAK8_9ACTN|nr:MULTISPECIES: DUF742 domain-containing protein [Streptomyces]KUM88446.1 hypothetical protein AQI94_12500 [Streptomyces pseudovenezuelae]WUA86472.1 DUF742 domain-containing protein [Streptomyces pseudovenezuelae]